MRLIYLVPNNTDEGWRSAVAFVHKTDADQHARQVRAGRVERLHVYELADPPPRQATEYSASRHLDAVTGETIWESEDACEFWEYDLAAGVGEPPVVSIGGFSQRPVKTVAIVIRGTGKQAVDAKLAAECARPIAELRTADGDG